MPQPIQRHRRHGRGLRAIAQEYLARVAAGGITRAQTAALGAASSAAGGIVYEGALRAIDYVQGHGVHTDAVLDAGGQAAATSLASLRAGGPHAVAIRNGAEYIASEAERAGQRAEARSRDAGEPPAATEAAGDRAADSVFDILCEEAAADFSMGLTPIWTGQIRQKRFYQGVFANPTSTAVFYLSLNPIVQGNDEGERRGRTVTLESVRVSSWFSYTSDVVGTIRNHMILYYVILDRQPNGTQATWNDVFGPIVTDYDTTPIMDQAQSRRFKILHGSRRNLLSNGRGNYLLNYPVHDDRSYPVNEVISYNLAVDVLPQTNNVFLMVANTVQGYFEGSVGVSAMFYDGVGGEKLPQ